MVIYRQAFMIGYFQCLALRGLLRVPERPFPGGDADGRQPCCCWPEFLCLTGCADDELAQRFWISPAHLDRSGVIWMFAVDFVLAFVVALTLSIEIFLQLIAGLLIRYDLPLVSAAARLLLFSSMIDC